MNRTTVDEAGPTAFALFEMARRNPSAEPPRPLYTPRIPGAVETVRQAWAAGASLEEIGKQLGVSASAANMLIIRMRQAGHALPYRYSREGRTPEAHEDLPEIIAMYEYGHRPMQIATALGHPIGYVRARLANYRAVRNGKARRQQTSQGRAP